MLEHPQFDPIFLSLGPLNIHWYGLMYLLAFSQFWILGRYQTKKSAFPNWKNQEVEDLLFYGAIGVVVGGRLGEVIFYHPQFFLHNPSHIIRIWEGGMSFHGGLLGVLAATLYFCYKTQKRFLAVTDFIAPLVPLGYAFGRIGNFINAELVGRVIHSPERIPWSMRFANIDQAYRHPSQLYHALGDGLCLFLILWYLSRTPKPCGYLSGVFLVGYAGFRSLTEFFRQPDYIVSLAGLPITAGQMLSLPMAIMGVALLWHSHRTRTY